MKPSLLLLAAACLLACRSYSQDTIITLEGDKVAIIDYRLDETVYELEYKTPDLKIKNFNSDEVFSIKHQDGTETLLYKYDPAAGDGLEVEDMRQMVEGMSCARVHHRAPGSFVIGFAAGFGGVFLMPAVHGNLMYAPLVPLAAVTIGGISHVNAAARTREIYGRDMSLMFNYGYADRAKRKRMASLILGSVAGLASGVLISVAAGQ